jgi:hypothetical protein
MHASVDLGVAGLLYFLGVVPTALAWRTSQSISGLEGLQARLAAKPATGESGAACRRCGAPLDVRPGALGARCVFCGADNLLIVPKADAAKEKEEASEIDVEVQSAISKHDATRREDRATMWLLLAVGPLLFPLLCAAGWVMHRVFAL